MKLQFWVNDPFITKTSFVYLPDLFWKLVAVTVSINTVSHDTYVELLETNEQRHTKPFYLDDHFPFCQFIFCFIIQSNHHFVPKPIPWMSLVVVAAAAVHFKHVKK